MFTSTIRINSKKYLILALTNLMLFLCHQKLYAQKDSVAHTKLYSISGFGFGFTIGQKPHVLRPKFSSNFGVKIFPKNNGFFLYPNFDLLSFGYNQLYTDQSNPYKLRHAVSNFYLLTLAPGFNKTFGHANIYSYIGPGVGLIGEPHVLVNLPADIASIHYEYNRTASARFGLGLDYAFGDFVLFGETGYLHTFRQLQEHDVNVIPVYFGLRSDISGVLKVLHKKKIS